ncbi:hypothetical protein FVD15_07855 [Campylobacter volucris]|uniref:Uncharacterized protein n=1 Tax=Campylobacter volucris TaxID=1031542 RepID=A0AAE5YFQ9_9BACT|nr:hypothetical protein [Campylobacter volucris]AJC94830.1 hypothetical protein CVOL_1552 [Campylobacter volucris LMG 24379]KAB0579660.1 hypothetical protein F7P61_04265 [Campylobacter volucris]QBL12826.1 hypothetical protein A9460_00140 [Campylobacter volucris]QEL09048.1 hypothetical protein CVOLT_1559 [Campylobacter volucris]TXK66592.1 hypothetical protein FVD15_07855 [Campylobacter volucris]
MLKELLEIKKEMEPIIHECSVKIQVASREVIVRKREYEIYGPMIDRVYLDNAIYVKVFGSGRDTKSTKVDIKNGFYMVYTAPDKPTNQETMNKLKVSFESIDNKFISKILELNRRMKEILNKTQTTLAKASNMNVVIETNLGEASAATKFIITIKYVKDNQKLEMKNSKSAGSFRDTKNHINLVVDKNTDSAVCEKLLHDVEIYFIGK